MVGTVREGTGEPLEYFFLIWKLRYEENELIFGEISMQMVFWVKLLAHWFSAKIKQCLPLFLSL